MVRVILSLQRQICPGGTFRCIMIPPASSYGNDYVEVSISDMIIKKLLCVLVLLSILIAENPEKQYRSCRDAKRQLLHS